MTLISKVMIFIHASVKECVFFIFESALVVLQVGHLQRPEGVRFGETSQRHGVPLLLSESRRLSGRGRRTWRRVEVWPQTPSVQSHPNCPLPLHT